MSCRLRPGLYRCVERRARFFGCRPTTTRLLFREVEVVATEAVIAVVLVVNAEEEDDALGKVLICRNFPFKVISSRHGL